MNPGIGTLAAAYGEAKAGMAEQLGATEALLHVHAGLLIFVATALLLRHHMASVWPLAVVAVFALLNEVLDHYGPAPAVSWHSGMDLLNTVFWPAVLFVLARTATLFVRTSDHGAAGAGI